MDFAFFNPVTDAGVFGIEFRACNHSAGEQVGIARIVHPHFAHHLADNNFHVLIVDIHALHPVGALHFLYQVVLHRLRAADRQNVVRIDRAFGQAVAFFDHEKLQ